jgi:cell division protein FtsI (penicillin-binding protein 3)
LQEIVDDEMRQVASEWQPAAATAIVLDPKVGAVLALADPATARRAYVPGSTLKAITIAAALDAGAIRADQRVDCGGGARSYGERVLRDAGANGWLPVPEVLAVSSNVGTSKIFEALGGARLREYLGRFHFGDASPVELRDVARGELPEMLDGDPFEAAVAAIGLRVTATPLQIAAAYAALANGGEYVAPTLVRRVLDESGRAAQTRAPAPERVIRAETARAVMTMLEGAVHGDRATGKGARIQGARVAGKTGTAEWTTPDSVKHTYSSFVGVVPADAPRYVILVGVEAPRDGAPGGKVAAPPFARIAARALSR